MEECYLMMDSKKLPEHLLNVFTILFTKDVSLRTLVQRFTTFFFSHFPLA